MRTAIIIHTILFFTFFGMTGCVQLPPNTPTAFKTYSLASHQRIETLQRTTEGLNLERSKTYDATKIIKNAFNNIDLTKPLNDSANTAAIDQINAMIAVLARLSKPDTDVNATIARIDSDLQALTISADMIYSVLNEVVSQQNDAGGALDAATKIVTDLSRK